MVATEPLDAEAVQRLGGGHTFIVELNKAYVFYRLHQGRLVYGGVETFFRTPESDFEVPASIHKALERHLAKSVPWRRNLKIGVAWAARSTRRRPTCRSLSARRARAPSCSTLATAAPAWR